jgi:leucine dehydrogenase
MKLTKHDIDGYENVVTCSDKESGLESIIAIHDTTLGPAIGGTRLWPYSSSSVALKDVLRLAQGMTRKASIWGLNSGGGKGIISARPEEKTEKLLRAYGKFVDTFNGKFITGEDMNINVEDVRIIAKETKHILGTEEEYDPSPFTAHGVVCGMKACAKVVYDTSDLSDLTIAIQGLGHVGYNLVKELREKEGVRDIIAADINLKNARKAALKFGIYLARSEEIHAVPHSPGRCDIFSPCAVGAILNSETIPQLKCKIVAGAANNQLEHDMDGQLLHDKRIIYAPDYVINAGGLIAIYMSRDGATKEEIMAKIDEMENKIGEIISLSMVDVHPTYLVARELADERISKRKEWAKDISSWA